MSAVGNGGPRKMAPRTRELHEAICADAAAKVRHIDTCVRLKVGSRYVTEVRQYFLQTGVVPPVPFEPLPAKLIRRNPQPVKPGEVCRDEAKIYMAETRQAQAEQEARRRRRLTPRNPTEGSAFPVPIARLMGARA